MKFTLVALVILLSACATVSQLSPDGEKNRDPRCVDGCVTVPISELQGIAAKAYKMGFDRGSVSCGNKL